MAAETGATTSRLLNRLAYDIANKATSLTGANSATGDQYVVYDTSAEELKIITRAEQILAMNGGTAAGTVTASMAVVVDANKDISAFRNVTVTNLDAGASGTAGTVDIFPTTASKGKLALACVDQTGNTTVTVQAEAMAAARTISLRDPGAAATLVTTTDTTGTAITSTVAELNKLDDSVVVLTPGAGVSAAETNKSSYFKAGGIITTQILVDLTGLVGSATDLDIIGNTGAAASAHFGQITAALNGTIAGGKVTCLEVPAGGADDIDFYSATVSTGAQDTDITTLTETVLLTRGAAWVAGDVKALSGFPPANDYLYIVNGEAVGGTFTAGKFLIELYGV